MIARVYAATAIGFNGKLIEVECDASNGLPTLLIVGLGNKAIDEAKERVRSAIKNAGLEFPRKRITINLAPANLPKDGAHFDLAIAIALLTVSGQLKQESVQDILFIGELALDGSLRPVRGVISHAETARDNGITTIIVPAANTRQAQLVEGLKVLPANSLSDVFMHISGTQKLEPAPNAEVPLPTSTQEPKLEEIRGQEQAKRTLLIAAAGGHNLLLSGPPGAGKTMLAKTVSSILPPLSMQEIVEVTKVHSLAGESYEDIIYWRPFRSPHHSSSHVALVGGGAHPRPGEISLAHRGVLFLDELPEYNRLALEALRQPLEDRVVSISRATNRATYPADFMLIATQNPCPCGYAGDPERECSCSPVRVVQYQKKISGPLLDRIDMVFTMSRVDHKQLLSEQKGLTSSDGKKLIAAARKRQKERFGDPKITNANMTSKMLNKKITLPPDTKGLLDTAAHTLQLSARAYFKAIKVAQTIADLDNADAIGITHISEALQYRPHTSNT